ncbi:MAG: DPP IV N-terminal domain-containing protein [Acidobacteriota bacterium]
MAHRKRFLQVSLCLLLAQAVLPFPGRSQAAQRREILFTDIVPEGKSQAPKAFHWSPDGTRLAYLRDDGQGQALWILDPVLGHTRRLLAAGDLIPSEPTPGDTESEDAAGGVPASPQPAIESMSAFHWSPSGKDVLIEASGDLFLVDLARAGVRRLTATESAETDPKFSPPGTAVAFVRDHDLHFIDLASGAEAALTHGGIADESLNGETDWVYWEEIWGRRSTGFWWSPDGKQIAFYHFDDTPVRRYALVNAMPQYPEVTWQPYPKAGEANPVVQVGVLSVPDGKTIWMQTGDPGSYLARVAWRPDGKALAIQRLNREQDRLELLLCGPRDGHCPSVLTESWPTWVNLGNDFAFLDDGRFIWGSDRLGWRALFLYGADGRRGRRLTPENWAVTSLDDVDEDAGEITVTAFSTDSWGATDRQVFRVPLSRTLGSVKPLSARPGWNTALVAPGTGLWLHTFSDADTPPRRVVRGGVLDRPVPLPAPEPPYEAADLPRWEFLTIDGPGGMRLPARILRPIGAGTGQRLPVIMYHYGCPASQVVLNRWDGGRNLWHKKMAQSGYVIFSVDNPTSIFFGKDGEDKAYRRFGELNLQAQLAGVEYLTEQSFVDPARIGLWGWSGGGSNTLYCLLNRPGVWRAGVAGAPVTDWRLYDSIWTERYLDRPQDDPEGYDLSSAVSYAANLKDRLLIVHGTADDNVHPQNTLVMIRKFVEAGVLHEDAIYPREKHGFRQDSSRHFYRRMTDFFERHLAAR